jgi:hypothetical protein
MKTRVILSIAVLFLALYYFLFLRSSMKNASLLLVNGSVHTVNDVQPSAQAIAVVNGRIAAVGSTADIQAAYRAPQVIDLKGRAAYPGFIDSHAHLEGLGAFLMNLDLTGTKSPEEIMQRVKERVNTTAPGVWIRGRGWDQNDWAVKHFPTRHMLDAIAPDVPVYLKRVDGHAVWVNTKVLQLAGITERTADPEGGKILRDNNGYPTGIFIDNATDLLDEALPDPPVGERTEAVLRAVNACTRVGLTGVHDMGVDLELIDIYKSLIAAGRLPLRVYAAIDGSGPTWEYYRTKGPEIGTNDGRLTIRSLKLYADGALGSYGAALIEPYADEPSTRGLTLLSTDSMRALGREVVLHGFQLSVHAIGDRANHVTLDMYEELFQSAGKAGADLRFRVEHAQILEPADIPRFAKLGVIPAMQPTHCTSDMYWVERRLGRRRLQGAYAWRSLIDAGSIVPGGSDFPVEGNNPLWGFHAAVTRQDHSGFPPGGWMPEQRMTRVEALKAFTVWGAYAAFEEGDKGTLAPGKLADIVVLSDDIMQVAPETILQTTVHMTIVGGEIVYAADSFAGGPVDSGRGAP